MIPVPLSVTFHTAATVMRMNKALRDLTFRTTVPGGYASATFSLDRRLLVQPPEIAYFGTARVTDTRSGVIVWEGRIEDPGRSSGSDGEIWQLTAVGPATHALDTLAPYIVVDKRFSALVRSTLSASSFDVNTEASDVDEEGALTIGVPSGHTVTSGTMGAGGYSDVYFAGQTLARVFVRVKCGAVTASQTVRLRTNPAPGQAWNIVDSATYNTAEELLVGAYASVLPTGQTRLQLENFRNGVTGAVASDNNWASFYDLVIRTLLKDASGADLTDSSNYFINTVLGSQVVADVLGRFLPLYDGAGASIETTAYAHEQLAWPAGVTPAAVFERLIEQEPGFYWGAYEANAAGKNRFLWRSWPTSVRYEASVVDGIESPASGEGLYDKVYVWYTDSIGRQRSVLRTQTVPELAAAGLSRVGTVDLEQEVGNTGAANSVGDGFLGDHLTPPNAGTLVVTRPILDRDRGRMVMPWEIEPGHIIRVRGINPHLDSLNATDRDGIAVFRVVSKEFSTSDAAASLELDSFTPTVARSLARLRQLRRAVPGRRV